MNVIEIQNPGADYKLIVGQRPRPKPGPGEVLVAVEAIGLNNADLLQARGLYPPPQGASDILGMEVSGRIVEMAPDVVDWTEGARVCALVPGGGYAEFVVANAGCVLPVSDQVDLVEAAGLPEAAFTAWTNIIDSGRLKAHETLLIHGGTSGIGSLAIQMFAARGHRVFATAGSQRKCDACKDFGAAYAINYTSEDFVQVVKAQTKAMGVDVILDMVGGSYIQRNIEAAAPWGRIVNIAYQDGSRVEVNFVPVLIKRLTLAATTLRGRTWQQKRAIRDRLWAEIWPLLGTRIKPVIDRTFPLSQAQQAHDFMKKKGHIGKILLTIA